jgi:uncharacterized protein with von Willebrand factor type A (vWA) domain
MARTVLVPPREHCWIESDLFDRSLFGDLVRDTPSLAALVESGGTLVPHFRDLLEDVFCLLYKLDPAWRDTADVGPSAALNRVLLESLRDHPLTGHLRAETQLDETQAGLATVLLGEQLLAMIRAERLVPRGDMLDLWDLEQKEELVRSAAEQHKALEGEGASADAKKRAARTAELAEAQLRQKTRQVEERLREMPARARQVLPAAASGLRRQLAESREDAQGWGDGLGAGGGNGGAGRQIELGRRLVTNPKLKRLAALVGRMRPQAMALRRRTLERSSEEVHDVELAGTLERLLPPELLALRHPGLRRDFARRLIEGQLLAYRLHGTDRHGRGPMIVCLDGSSSMAGDKEIWSKAVALTLLEIARRQRRLFRFVCFASRETPLYTLDLNPREHHTVQADRAFDLAEYFPGGGTDFETPLDAATGTLGGARYRRGDVVLITDGECRVSPEWLARFRAEKKRLDFSLYSVLIDVGSSSAHTLADFSDRVTSVSELTDAGVRDLFRQLR